MHHCIVNLQSLSQPEANCSQIFTHKKRLCNLVETKWIGWIFWGEEFMTKRSYNRVADIYWRIDCPVTLNTITAGRLVLESHTEDLIFKGREGALSIDQVKQEAHFREKTNFRIGSSGWVSALCLEQLSSNKVWSCVLQYNNFTTPWIKVNAGTGTQPLIDPVLTCYRPIGL